VDMLKSGPKQIRTDSGIAIKPISPTGTKRLVRRAIQHALEHKRKVVTLVHKGNIQKFTEGAFRDWGYDLATEEFRNDVVTERESWILDNRDRNAQITIEQNAEMIEPGLEQGTEEFRKAAYDEVKSVLDKIYATHGQGKWKQKLMINDRIADSIFQQVVTRADEYEVLATPNLNGDYISDACAAQIGGLGMAPGANIGDGFGCFEATHGTAPKYADKDVINPSSVILSGVMMFDFMGWPEVGRLIEAGSERTISQKRVTYDLERLMEGAKKLRTSEYATAIIENMQAAPVAK
jgi:isocitrate dehydrogenase